jgi:hypothetical protein
MAHEMVQVQEKRVLPELNGRQKTKLKAVAILAGISFGLLSYAPYSTSMNLVSGIINHSDYGAVERMNFDFNGDGKVGMFATMALAGTGFALLDYRRMTQKKREELGAIEQAKEDEQLKSENAKLVLKVRQLAPALVTG